MFLIGPLAAGIAGAGNGTAKVTKRGTSTAPAVYMDFEGGSQYSSNTLALDANGGVVAYVDQLVTVEVKDSLGTIVRTFTAGEDVRSLSFTGTDYNTGAGAAGNPTTEDAVKDLWLTNNGAIDWQVLFDGSATTIQAALASVGGFFRNVKSSTYGATGDGSTNDTTAIQNCLNAGDGVVFFPPGTYRTTSALQTFSNKIVVLGSGADSTFIRVDSASSVTALQCDPASGQTGSLLVKDITLDAAQTQTNPALRCGSSSGATSAEVTAIDCVLGSSDYSAPLAANVGVAYLTEANGTMRLVRCTLKAATLSATQNFVGTTAGDLQMESCRLIVPASGSGTQSYIYLGDEGTIRDLYVDNSAETGGTHTIFDLNNSSVELVTVYGTRVSDVGPGTSITQMFDLTSSSPVVEDNNQHMGQDTAAGVMYVNGGSAPQGSYLGSREAQQYVATINTGAFSVFSDQCASADILYSYGATDATPTITLPIGHVQRGAKFYLSLTVSGAACTPTFTNGVVPGGSSASIADGETDSFLFVYDVTGWVQVGYSDNVS